jgi:UPF0148 protein
MVLSGEGLKDMAELLRTGAKMLDKSCPECSSPLFQLKSGEIWCANCQRRVVIVREGEETATETGLQLDSLEKALMAKVSSLTMRLAVEEEPEKLKGITEVINSLLSSLEKLRGIKQG